MAKSTLDQVKELEEKKRAIIGKARDEALTKANEAVKELKDLGFNYRLTTATGVVGSKGSVKDDDCDICKFKTDPPHDGRKHRSQKRKKAFTAADLKELGLVRVG